MLMSVLMELTAVIKYVATLLEATLVHVTLAIVWHLMDKYVMVSPIHWSITCHNIILCKTKHDYNLQISMNVVKVHLVVLRIVQTHLVVIPVLVTLVIV